MKPNRLFAAAGLAVASHAAADVNWNTRIEFARTPTGNAIASNTIFQTGTGTYTFFVRVGIFDLTGLAAGQANHGLARWMPTLTVTGLRPGDSVTYTEVDPRPAPFNFGPPPPFPPASPISLDFSRDLGGSASAPWLWDTATNAPAAMPIAPADWAGGPFADRGANATFNLFRFTMTSTHFTGTSPDIFMTFSGQAGPILRWAAAGTTPPTGPSTPGTVFFTGETPNPALRDFETATLIYNRSFPTPGTLSVFAAPVLVVCRRRRRAIG